MIVSHWGIFPGYWIAKYVGYSGATQAVWVPCEFDYLVEHQGNPA